MFYVWVRNDNYIDVSCHMPKDYKYFGREEHCTYKLLKSFAEWSIDVVDFIEQERDRVKGQTK